MQTSSMISSSELRSHRRHTLPTSAYSIELPEQQENKPPLFFCGAVAVGRAPAAPVAGVAPVPVAPAVAGAGVVFSPPAATAPAPAPATPAAAAPTPPSVPAGALPVPVVPVGALPTASAEVGAAGPVGSFASCWAAAESGAVEARGASVRAAPVWGCWPAPEPAAAAAPAPATPAAPAPAATPAAVPEEPERSAARRLLSVFSLVRGEG